MNLMAVSPDGEFLFVAIRNEIFVFSLLHGILNSPSAIKVLKINDEVFFLLFIISIFISLILEMELIKLNVDS
jgi:hypothetical protein